MGKTTDFCEYSFRFGLRYAEWKKSEGGAIINKRLIAKKETRILKFQRRLKRGEIVKNIRPLISRCAQEHLGAKPFNQGKKLMEGGYLVEAMTFSVKSPTIGGAGGRG